MSKPTRNDIRQIARERIYHYSAVLDILDDASVRKGKRVDINGQEHKGWWVTCVVFVGEDHFDAD